MVRPPAVYGPGERDLMELFSLAARGWAPRVGWRPRAYSFIHVDDLIEALVLAGLHEAARGGTYFVAHPEVVTPKGLASAVAAAVGGPVRSLPIPGMAPRLLGWLGGLSRPFRSRPPLLNPDRAREMGPRAWLCDPSAFRAATGWEAAIDLAEGTRRTAAWARSEGLIP